MALSRRPTELGYHGLPSPGEFRVTETFQVHFDVYKRKNNGVIHETMLGITVSLDCGIMDLLKVRKVR